MKNYTKIWILSACMVASLAFAGCVNSNGGPSSSQPPEKPSQNETQDAYKVQFIRAAVDSMELKDAPKAQAITSTEELASYLENMGDADNLNEALAKYDDAYFAGNVLIMIASIEESGSITYSIDRIESKDGKLTVFIDRDIPQVQTDDIAHWQTVIELSRTDYADAKEAAVQFNN